MQAAIIRAAVLLVCIALLLALHSASASPFSASPQKLVPRPAVPSTTRLDNVQERIWSRFSQRILGKAPPRNQKDDWSAAFTEDSVPSHIARYEGDAVLRFNISSKDEAIALLRAADIFRLDVWEHTDDWLDIRIAKHSLPSILTSLPEPLRHSHSTLLEGEGLVQAIYQSLPRQSPANTPNLAPSQTNLFFRDYQPLGVISHWMRLLESLFSTHVRLINIGISYEGRDILALRVGFHPTNTEKPSGPRKTIIISGGSHAREWISTSTANYVAYSLITLHGKSRIVSELLREYDWVFIPTLNPDGYDYSWTNDRLWRKNRQETSVQACPGIDLDRTWDFMWDGSPSANPCSETFAGAAAFEGVESRRFADWVKNETESNNVQFVGFLDLHSYSQQILFPFSYSCDAIPPTREDLEELAEGLAKAIRLDNHKQYKVASACQGNVDLHAAGENGIVPRMESGGGSALDWMYHEMQIRRAYQIKLRDTGAYGFLLPKQYIIPTGEEILHAVLYLGHSLLGTLRHDGTNTGSKSKGDSLNEAAPNPVATAETPNQGGTEAETDVHHILTSQTGESVHEWELRR